MNPFLVLGIALSLAMDCFAVSLGLSTGLRGLGARQGLRIAAHFGFFQFAMSLGGWIAGGRLLGIIGRYDHWVAFGLLAAIGGKMIAESFEKRDREKTDQTKGSRLLVLAVATSIDALVVGMGIGVMGSGILVPAAVIGVVSFGMTVLGSRIGPAVGRVAGKRAELLGGLILIGIGVRILLAHLAG